MLLHGPPALGTEPLPLWIQAVRTVRFLAERKLGRFRLFINAENLTNVRQTKWNSLIRPARGVDGRWTVEAWAPLDGRVFNGGIRMRLRGETIMDQSRPTVDYRSYSSCPQASSLAV